MYIRLNSRVFPTKTIKSEEFENMQVSQDKSCMLLKGEVTEDGIKVGPIAANVHALHIYRNPALGSSLQVLTPDDGPQDFAQPSKAKLKLAADLDYHYKIFIVRIALPDYST